MPDNGFAAFAAFPARPSGRYAPGTRVGTARPWMATEDLLLWPVLLNCHSERAYLRSCVLLCETLGRVPKFPDSHPTQQQIVMESVALIERRTVTGALSDRCPELFQLAARIAEPQRMERPLTWAEKVRILKPYHAKPGNGQPRVDWRNLALLLFRSECRDRAAVDEYLAGLDERPPPSVLEDLYRPSPMERAAAVKCVRTILEHDPDDLAGLAENLAVLNYAASV